MGRAARRQAVIRDSRSRVDYPELLELVASHATSRPGKEAVAALTPFEDLTAIEETLEEVEELRSRFRARGTLRLDGLVDIPELVSEQGVRATRPLTPEELFSVAGFLERNHVVGDELRRSENSPRLLRRGERLPDQRELRERLRDSVNAQGEVLDSASESLGTIRRKIDEEEKGLREWMERRRQRPDLRKALQGDVVTVRNDRFVFAVRAEHRAKVRGIVHGESASGATIFIEPQEIVLRGNELQSLRHKERHEIARILAELSSHVRQERVKLIAIYEALLELDTLVARARFGEAFGATAPQVVKDRQLRLRDARHPLLMWQERQGLELDLESAHKRVVPLDLDLDREHYQLIVTGPNTGGKTVVLKTVGLLTLMAYTAIPVTAAPGCTVPLFDAVLADIGDEQSLEQNLSTFSSHMTVIGEILELVSSRSLVLLDELGAGTDPLEGAALAESILERLYERGAFTFVTTHLGRLKEFAFRRKKAENASMEFDPGKLAPTYRLQTGIPGRSNALIIARRIGVPTDVVDAAEALLAGEERVDEEVIAGLERTRHRLERNRSEMEKEAHRARELKEEAAAEVEALKDMRASIEAESERAEEERVHGVIDAVEASLKEMGEPPRDRRGPFDRLRAFLEEARQGTRLAERRRERAHTLRKGDPVFIPRFRAVTEVKKINKSREVITVSLNGIATEVTFQEISWVLPPPGYELEWYES